MNEMVLGFLFNEQGGLVVLIKKNKPEWQKGLLNGIGGKIEEGETPHAAMIREFKEEAGLEIEDWQQFAIMQGADWKVYCFKAFSDIIYEAKTVETEDVCICHINSLLLRSPNKVISNLHWLINMALDANDNFDTVVTYK